MSRDLVGKVVGAYRLGEIADWGKGPNASIYEAEHAASGNKVTVKIYGADLSKDKNAAARLTAEVQRATQVKHPNLAEVLDVGTTEQKGRRLLYVVTEWLRGETLQMRLSSRKAPLPLPLVLQIASDVGAALQAIHRQGGAHRAISAAAIFLSTGESSEDGELSARLLDQGAAHVEALSAGETLPKGQAAAAEDLKALARVLREALSKPDGQGSLRAQNPAVPAHVDHALRAALGELGTDGYSSPAAFIGALLGAGAPPSVGPWSSDGSSVPLPPRAGLGMGWIVGSLALAGGVVLWLTHREPQGPPGALADLASPRAAAADLLTPAVAMDQAAPAATDLGRPVKDQGPAADQARADAAQPAADLTSPAAPDLAKSEEPVAEPVRKPPPKRTGPPIPPVRGPLAWNPNLKFAPPKVAAPPEAAKVETPEPVKNPNKPKRPKRTGPPIPPLRP